MEAATGSRLRGVVIPAEHGGWGLTLEPAVLGLAVAPSAAGVALGFAALAAFLLRTPLKIALGDRRRHRELPRTRLATRATAAYGSMLVGSAVGAVALADHSFWSPLALALPLMAVQIGFDVQSRSRRLVPEIAGPVGIGSVAAAIALAGGQNAKIAYGLWLVVALRAASSVVLVRAQLRRARQQPHREAPVHAVDTAALAIAVPAAASGTIPWLGAAALALLTPFGLWEMRRAPVRATLVGIHQTIVGVAIVILASLGVRAGW